MCSTGNTENPKSHKFSVYNVSQSIFYLCLFEMRTTYAFLLLVKKRFLILEDKGNECSSHKLMQISSWTAFFPLPATSGSLFNLIHVPHFVSNHIDILSWIFFYLYSHPKYMSISHSKTVSHHSVVFCVHLIVILPTIYFFIGFVVVFYWWFSFSKNSPFSSVQSGWLTHDVVKCALTSKTGWMQKSIAHCYWKAEFLKGYHTSVCNCRCNFFSRS